MEPLSPSLQFFVRLAKIHTVMSRRFDAGLGGLGFSDFLILYHLSQAKDEKLRRTDLADRVGLTASGITRLLAPMEKIGLVKRETTADDARVSYVVLGRGGKQKLADAMIDSEDVAKSAIPSRKHGKMRELDELLEELIRPVV